MSSQRPKNKKEYDIFVCYYEITGKDFATMIHRALTERGYRVFVAHIERPYLTGNFRDIIDNVINNCQTFILLNTLDALTRSEVIREVRQAFPNGIINKDKFWIFRENADDVPRNESSFQEETKINLSIENQSDFNNDSELARSVLRKCRQTRESIILQADTLAKKKPQKIIQSDYLEKSIIMDFAERMRKKGFTAEIQKDMGNNFYADLILQKDNQIILCEFKKLAKSVRSSVIGKLLLYKSELEHITPKNKIDLWLIAQGNFDSTMKDLAKKYGIQLIDDSNLESYIGYDQTFFTTDIQRTHFGATVELDQKVYTWTDRVYITVVAPSWNLDPSKIDEIEVSVSTNEYTLSNYKLVETGPNTGIFSGYVILTGDPDVKGYEGVDGNGSKPTGKIGGTGPTNGLLRARDSDVISVSFEFTKDQTVTGSALVRWNIGEIKWLEANYSANSEAILQIVDPDMNLNPATIDKFYTNIWSDSDPNGIQVTMEETGESTGIFQGKIHFTKIPSSETQLRVTEGDTVTGEYKDRTLPPPYTKSDQLRLTATTFVGTIVPPLERIVMNNPIVESGENKGLEKIMINQVIRIGANISNNQNKEQPFAFLMNILDKNGITVRLDSMSGSLSAWQSFQPFLPWITIEPGTYFVQLFVWQSINNPNALSAPLQFKIVVSQNDKSVKDISSDDISGILVSIPRDTGVPGCEKTCGCYMPSKLIINSNQTVTWFNEDTTSHTIVSGKPFDNETGTIFDSGMIKPGKTFDYNFKTKGIFYYFCVVHPWQVGVIIVK